MSESPHATVHERIATLNLPRPLNRQVGLSQERSDRALTHADILRAFETCCRIMALTLCAICRHCALDSQELRAARKKLFRPTFGAWVGLLRAAHKVAASAPKSAALRPLRPVLDGLDTALASAPDLKALLATIESTLGRKSTVSSCLGLLEEVASYRNAFAHPEDQVLMDPETRRAAASTLVDGLLTFCEIVPPTGAGRIVIVERKACDESNQLIAGFARMHGEFADVGTCVLGPDAWNALTIGTPYLFVPPEAFLPLYPFAAARKDRGKWDLGWMSGRSSAPTLAYQAANDVFHVELKPAEYEAVIGDAPDESAAQDEIVYDGEAPYRGILSYEEAHASLYFGREEEVAEAVSVLRSRSVVILTGASGSGKSSFMKAGIVPALREQSEEHGAIRVMALRPGSAPLAAVRHALLELSPEGQAERATWSSHVNTAVPHAGEIESGRLAPVIDGLTPGLTRLVVCIDQLEEAATLCRDPAERSRFLDFVTALATAFTDRVYVVATMRSDCSSLLDDHEGFRRLLNSGSLYTVAAIPASRLDRVILGPVRDRAPIEPGLVDLILRDVGSRSGALPLLSQVLKTLFEQRDGYGGRLSVAGYRAAGGLTGALGAQADAARAEIPPDRSGVLDALLLKLVSAQDVDPLEESEDGRDAVGVVRRRVPLPVLSESLGMTAAEITALIEPFVRRRLLVVGTQAMEGDQVVETVELAHEALATSWPHYADLIKTRSEILFIEHDLENAETRWRAGTGDLWTDRNSSLARAETLRAEGRLSPSRAQAAFLESSRRALQQRRRRTAALVGLVFLAVAAGAVVAFLFYLKAEEQRRDADAHKIIAQKEAAVAESERKKADLATVEATRQADDARRQRLKAEEATAEAKSQAEKAEDARAKEERARIEADESARAAKTAKEDSDALLVEKRAEAFALKAERSLAEGRASESLAYAAASLCVRPHPLIGFLAAQARLATAPCRWISPQMAAGSAALVSFAEGGTVFTVAGDQGVSVRSTRTGLQSATGSAAQSVANPLSPCGDSGPSAYGADGGLVVHAFGETVTVWETSTERAQRSDKPDVPDAGRIRLRYRFELPALIPAIYESSRTDSRQQRPYVTAAAVSARTSVVVIALSEGTIASFGPTSPTDSRPKPLKATTRAGSPVTAIAMSESGDRCACARGSSIGIIDVATHAALSSLDGGAVPVLSLAWDGEAQGGRLVAGGEDGEIASFDLGVPGGRRRVIGRQDAADEVVNVAFDPSDPRAVFSCGGQLAYRWSLDGGGPVRMRCDSLVTSIACSPDGKTIVTTEDGPYGARRWLPDGREVLPPVGHSTAVDEVRYDAKTDRIVTSSSDGTIRFWSPSTGEQTAVTRAPPSAAPGTWAGTRPLGIALSPNGATGITMKRAFEIDKRPRRLRDRYVMPPPPPPPAAGEPSEPPKPRLLVFDTSGDRPPREVEIPAYPTSRIAFSFDGKKCAVGCHPDHLVVIDLAGDPRVIANHPRSHTVVSIAFLGKDLIAVGGPRSIAVLEGESFASRYDLTLPTGSLQSVHGAATNHEIAYTLEGDAGIHLWDVAITNGKQPDPLVGHAGAVTAVRCGVASPDGLTLAGSCSKDGTACLWDVGNRRPFRRIESSTPMTSMAMIGRTAVAAGHVDGTVRVWDVGWGHRHLGEGDERATRVFSVALSPAGRRLATGFGDGTFAIWDCETWKRRNYPAPAGIEAAAASDGSPDPRAVTAVSLPSDGPTALCGYANGRLSKWDEVGEHVLARENGVPIVAIRSDLEGRRAVVVSQRSVEVWNLALMTRTIRSDIGGCSPGNPVPSSVAFSENPGGCILCATADRIWALDAETLEAVGSEPRVENPDSITMASIGSRTRILSSCRIPVWAELGHHACTKRHPNVLVDFPPVGIVGSSALGSRAELTLADVVIFDHEIKWHRAWDAQVRCPEQSRCKELCDLLGEWEKTVGLWVDPGSGEIVELPVPAPHYAKDGYAGYCRRSPAFPVERLRKKDTRAPTPGDAPPPPPPPPATR
jgi:WD40 repeat protein